MGRLAMAALKVVARAVKDTGEELGPTARAVAGRNGLGRRSSGWGNDRS